MADELSIILTMLPSIDDVAHARPVCRAWSSDPFGQRALMLGRLADRLVARIKKTYHSVPAGASNPGCVWLDDCQFPTTVVDERMDTYMFNLLFGRQAGINTADVPVELVFKKPTDILAAIPGLPLAVCDVPSNAPHLPICPLRCWAGYADGEVKYDPVGSKFTLKLRTGVLKLSGYWEKQLDDRVMREYLEAYDGMADDADRPSKRQRTA